MWLINFLNTYSISSNIELIAVELQQNKREWLSWCVYQLPDQNDSVVVEATRAIINDYSAQYKHIVIFGDFIMSIENCRFENLMQIYHLSPLIKEPTYFQSHNSTCMDNFLTN